MAETPSNSLDPFLVSLGWSDFFQTSFDKQREDRFLKGRIVSQGRGNYLVQNSPGEPIEAAVTTKLHNSAKAPADFPAVGDWVAFTQGQGNQQAQIQRVLKRKNSIQRKRMGAKSEVQLIATNVDFMLVVTSCNEDFNLERLGRFFELGQESECTTVFLLTKSDLSENVDDYVQQLKNKFKNVEVLAISNKDPESLELLKKYFSPGLTSVLVGSSGVGKSTLTNFLLGFEAQKTQDVSSGSKGRHTTTARNLKITRWGGLVIDTPGMQEVTSDNNPEDVLKNFADVEGIALTCKFTNCLHKSEPGCAIRAALQSRSLTADRWEDYLEAVAKSASRSKRASKSRQR